MSGLFKDENVVRSGFTVRSLFRTGSRGREAGPGTGAADTGNPAPDPVSGETERIRLHFNWKTLVPLASLGLVLGLHQLIPTNPGYRVKTLPYFSVLLAILKTYNYRASVSEAETAIGRNARDLQRIKLVSNDVNVDALIRNTFVALPGVPDTLYQ
jgi:hypothetical protein